MEFIGAAAGVLTLVGYLPNNKNDPHPPHQRLVVGYLLYYRRVGVALDNLRPIKRVAIYLGDERRCVPLQPHYHLDQSIETLK